MKTPIKFKYDGQEADVVNVVHEDDMLEVHFSKAVYINPYGGEALQWYFCYDGRAVGFPTNGVMLIFKEDSKNMKNPMDNKDYWRVGAKVFSLAYGKGRITEIKNNHIYNIDAAFVGAYATYTREGKWFTYSLSQTLFYEDAITFDEQGRPVKIDYNYVPPHLNKPTFNHTKHKEMWNWLADNPDKCKSDWFNETGFKSIGFSKCFACFAANSSTNTKKHCPLMDGLCDGSTEQCLNGLYNVWVMPFTAQAAKSILAKAIADLPLSEHKDLYNII